MATSNTPISAAQATPYNSDPTMTGNPVQDSQSVNAPTPTGTDPSVSQTTQPPVSAQVQSTQPQSAIAQQMTAPGQPQPQVHPWANAIKSTAEVLAGGPRYRTTVDPNTGTVTKEQLPPDRRDIVWSIVLSALSGGLGGLSAKGPNATGQAAAIGLQQGQQIAQQRQQAEAQQDQQAVKNAEFAQITAANNLKLRALAQSIGKQGEEENARSVQADSTAYKAAQDAGAIVADNVSAKDAQDLKTYPLGDYDRLAVGYHQRLDAQGQPVFVSAGTGQVVPEGTAGAVPAFDRTYAIVKNAPVALTDDSGKNLPWVQKAIQRGDIISNGGNVAAGVRIPFTRAIGIQRNEALTDAAENDINALRKANGLEPLNLDADIKANHSLSQSLNSFIGQLNANGHNYQQALSAIAQTDPSAAGQLVNYYGGLTNLQKADDTTAFHKNENGYRVNGFKSQSEAEQAFANPNSSPDIKQAAQSYLNTDIGVEGKKAGAKAGAEAGAKLPYEEALENHKAAIAQRLQAGQDGNGPDAFGVAPKVTGKPAESVTKQYKTNLDKISQLDATQGQFRDIMSDVKAGELTGAEATVALFDAIGISAASLKGSGFRVSNEIIKEHAQARGLDQDAVNYLQKFGTGGAVTPQQILSYGNIADRAWQQAHLSLHSQMRAAGINADAALPQPNGAGQQADQSVKQVYARAAGVNPTAGDTPANRAAMLRARKAWQSQGWAD